MAKATIMVLDAWTFIPFMMIMLLAGLQAIPKELQEASQVDGATGWKAFWEITFPLMLPVSITAVLIRIIFKLKLADIVINTTAGGPGGATDTVTSFIFREYRDRSNVGYGTMLAMVYLVLIVIFMTDPDETRRALRETADLRARRMTDTRPDLSRQRHRPCATTANGGPAASPSIRVLILWAIICLFPIYWTLTTSFKMAPDVMKGNMIPWVDFTPRWKGWEAIGLSPETLVQRKHGARRVHEAFHQFGHHLAVLLGAGGGAWQSWRPTASAGSASNSAS